jgi:hypothetical protein
MGSRRPDTPKEIEARKKFFAEITTKLGPQIQAQRRAEFDELRRILNADEHGYDWWRIRGPWICRRRTSART